MIICQEHEKKEILQEKAEILLKNISKLEDYHLELSNNCLYAGYNIGICSIEDIIIKIEPKFNNDNVKVDILKMLNECLNDRQVYKHLSECYKIYYNEKPICIENKLCNSLYLFIVHMFVKSVQETVKHGLYKSFYEEENILKGKVKGKLLIKDTINIHLKENVKLKNKCIYETHDINNLENQILKYALKKAEIYTLTNKQAQNLYNEICMLKEKFNTVDNKVIKEIDFHKINRKIIHKGYKESLKLAYEVIKILDKNIYNNGRVNRVYPFYIDMPELFERYCEVKLRKHISDKFLKVGYKQDDKDSKTKIRALRPDFIITKGETINAPYILDSKYSVKYADIEKQNDSEENIKDKIGLIKDHLEQLSLYGRTKKLQEKANAENSSEVNLCILYPVISNETVEYDFEKLKENKEIENKYKSKNIEKMYYLPIKIPTLKN